MTNPLDASKKEHPSTYFVPDRQNEKELLRLTIQDRMLTESMGGALPEQSDPTVFRRVLDIGCGSGSWVIEAAQKYETMSLVGVDISSSIISYARSQAEVNLVANRVEFRTMDALRMLELPAGSFDLVNLRLGGSFMRTWDWPKMLSEMLRMARPGGTIRLTDQNIMHSDDSPAYRRCNEMFLCAFFRAGHLFEQESDGLSAHLAPLLKQYGCQHVQTKMYPLEYRAGTPNGQTYYEDMANILQTAIPFVRKWGCLPEEYDVLYRQALDEMRSPDFHTVWTFLAAWGVKPV